MPFAYRNEYSIVIGTRRIPASKHERRFNVVQVTEIEMVTLRVGKGRLYPGYTVLNRHRESVQRTPDTHSGAYDFPDKVFQQYIASAEINIGWMPRAHPANCDLKNTSASTM